MTARIFRLLCWVFAVGLFGSCQPETPSTPPDTVDYFPLITGQYIIYDVAEQRYSFTAAPVSLIYQRKEVTGSAYADVTNQPAYRIFRYRRTTESQPWQLDSVWSTRRSRTDAIRTENGRDIVKIVFPVTENARWNANRLNSMGADEYELRNVGRPFSVSGMTFGETATVVQQDDSTLVGQDKRREVYAGGVGLIYKEVIQLQFCTDSPGCIGKNQVVYGLQQIYCIRSYGRE